MSDMQVAAAKRLRHKRVVRDGAMCLSVALIVIVMVAVIVATVRISKVANIVDASLRPLVTDALGAHWWSLCAAAMAVFFSVYSGCTTLTQEEADIIVQAVAAKYGIDRTKARDLVNRLRPSTQLSIAVDLGAYTFANHEHLNVNYATEEDFAAIRGVGVETARRIVQDRTEHGPFHDAADFRTRLSGLASVGPGRISAIVDSRSLTFEMEGEDVEMRPLKT